LQVVRFFVDERPDLCDRRLDQTGIVSATCREEVNAGAADRYGTMQDRLMATQWEADMILAEIASMDH
jgi:hypothetical protein